MFIRACSQGTFFKASLGVGVPCGEVYCLDAWAKVIFVLLLAAGVMDAMESLVPRRI